MAVRGPSVSRWQLANPATNPYLAYVAVAVPEAKTVDSRFSALMIGQRGKAGVVELGQDERWLHRARALPRR